MPSDLAMQTLPWGYQGERLRWWIENRTAQGCPIPMTTVTIESLGRQRGYWQIYHVPKALTPVRQGWMARWGLPVEGDIVHSQSVYRAIEITESPTTARANTIHSTHWKGVTGPGVLIIDDMRRRNIPPHPHIAEFCKAVYEQDYPLAGLRYIFVANVVNQDTMDFINHHIPRPSEEWAEDTGRDTSSEITTYDTSSPEYLGLLGTRIGKVIGYFILAAYGQGIKRISEISLWLLNDHWQLLFVLEDIPAKQESESSVKKSNPDFMRETKYLRTRREWLTTELEEPAPQKQQTSY
ncbi:hypothetical protein N7535_003438 [Penicillium sp. DV-2018c]|nr:hypothetical protein N7461_000865 [Penicillium sp. DV-2018c]KAJ5576512.1 hypothetical protein N7535_003438 [Penicillium sp. DV-2018c]